MFCHVISYITEKEKNLFFNVMKKVLLLTVFLYSFCGMMIAGNKSKLLYTDELVSVAKNKMKNDSLMKKAWNEIKSVADTQLKRNSL